MTAKQTAKPTKLVVIDPAKMTYSAYSGRNKVGEVGGSSLCPEWIEYFRVCPNKVLEEVDGENGQGPEVA